MFNKYKLPTTDHKLPFNIGGRIHTVSFDFVANTPLETCKTRLSQLQDLRQLDPWVPKTRVHFDYVNDQTYAFIIREKEPAPVELRGYLNRLDDERAYISGQASAKIYLQAAEFLFLFGLIVLLTIFVGLFVAVLFLPPLGIFMRYYWHGARRERDRLVAVVRDTLTY
jgi:hypothetical protein